MENAYNDHQKEKEFLRGYYADYDAKRHDVFKYRYLKEQEAIKMQEYLKNRGICN